MHAMLGDVLDRHRQEGAGPDMKRDLGKPDPGLGKRIHQARREMESGRRRCHGSRLGGEHRLVILGVGVGAAVRTADIGRQRHAAMPRKPGLERLRFERFIVPGIDEFEDHLAAFAASFDTGREIRAEDDHVTGTAFARRLGEDPPARAALMLVEGDADPGLAAACRKAAPGSPACCSPPAGRRFAEATAGR